MFGLMSIKVRVRNGVYYFTFLQFVQILSFLCYLIIISHENPVGNRFLHFLGPLGFVVNGRHFPIIHCIDYHNVFYLIFDHPNFVTFLYLTYHCNFAMSFENSNFYKATYHRAVSYEN